MKDQQQEIEKFQISDINDQFQQFSARFPLSNDTSGESPEESYEVTGSVVNRSETCSDTRTQEQFDPICESNSDGVQGNSNTHAETSSSGNDQESSLGRIDQNVKDSSRRDGVMDTIQTELQFVTKLLTALTLLTLLSGRDEMQDILVTLQTELHALPKAECLTALGNLRDKLQEFLVTLQTAQQALTKAEYLTALGNLSSSRRQVAKLCEKMISYINDQQQQVSATFRPSYNTRSYSVVNCKVHWLEQADASDILKLDSNVMVGLTKSSHLQEILLDISPIFDSLVHRSQPVTLQTFQGIMQRMGLPVNPQLYEQLENSYTTNDSEELSYVIIFAEDCQMYFYIPVLRGSLRPSLQTIDYRNTLLPP